MPHAASPTSPAERAKLLKRLARIAAAREPGRGARPKQALRRPPADPTRWRRQLTLGRAGGARLAQVLARLDGGIAAPAPRRSRDRARDLEPPTVL